MTMELAYARGPNPALFPLLLGRAGGQTIIGGTATGDKLTLQGNSFGGSDAGVEILSTASGASGAIFEMYHNSASPAVSDVPTIIDLFAKDAGGNKTLIGEIATVMVDPANGALSSYMRFRTRDAGATKDIYFYPTARTVLPDPDAYWDLGIAATGRFRSGYFSSIVDVGTGFRIAGAATAGNLLIGNGTNFVSRGIINQITLGDTSYTIVAADVQGYSGLTVRCDPVTVARTVTLPASSLTNGCPITVWCNVTTGGTVIVSRAGSDTFLDSLGNSPTSVTLNANWESITLTPASGNLWIVTGRNYLP